MKKYLSAGLLCLISPLATGGVLDERAFIGKWMCLFNEPDLYIRSTSVIEYRHDGTMFEKSTLHQGKSGDDAYQIDNMQMSGKWRISGDKFISYDHVIQSYAVDMPNYHKIEQFRGKNKSLAMSMKTMMARAETQAVLADGAVSRIKFLDKNTFIIAYEGVDDDFPTDIKNNHCKRL